MEHAIAGRPVGLAYVLDQGARPLVGALRSALGDALGGTLGGALGGALREAKEPAAAPPITLAVGPEGGFEAEELAALEAAGFARVALGSGILRFETAALAGLAVVRATLEALGGAGGP